MPHVSILWIACVCSYALGIYAATEKMLSKWWVHECSIGIPANAEKSAWRRRGVGAARLLGVPRLGVAAQIRDA